MGTHAAVTPKHVEITHISQLNSSDPSYSSFQINRQIAHYQRYFHLDQPLTSRSSATARNTAVFTVHGDANGRALTRPRVSS